MVKIEIKKIKDLTDEDKRKICIQEDDCIGDCYYCRYVMMDSPYCKLEKTDEATLNMEVEVVTHLED